ncbi:MAG: TetR/AcrR family transcriptional regulator [Proteobacteria bacterium]|nr:TetR/AcrR family transcriptional regulator [Pseudomonadota bacterium]
MSTKLLREQERLDNRDKRLQSILDAGKELFAERGLAVVNMKEIAEKAQISRATLYRYFPSKEDLAFAIEHYFYREILLPQYKEQLSKAKGNGFEKVSFHFKLILGSYRLYPDYYKFTGAFDHYFNYRQQPAELAEEMNRIFNKDFEIDPMVTFIQEGIDDGSIRPGIDPYLTAKTFDQTLLSLCQRMASRKEEMELEFNIKNSDDLIENLVAILLNGIKNT